jgi:hypothetical protein
MSEDTYQGWANYPTWAVNLWLSNDESLYRETLERASEFKGAPHRLAGCLKDWVSDELAPDLGASFAADLLGYALGEVDWYEIATSWIQDLDS